MKKFEPDFDCNLFTLLKLIGINTCKDTWYSNILSNRLKEVGTKLEVYVKNAGQMLALDIDEPKGASYPDLKIRYNNTDIYIKVKSYGQQSEIGQISSTFPSPLGNLSIDSDGFHIIMGFDIEEIESQNPSHYAAKGFHLVDAYGLNCSVKFEANSNNATMYSDPQILYAWNVQSE